MNISKLIVSAMLLIGHGAMAANSAMNSDNDADISVNVQQHLVQLAHPTDGIGARFAGSEEENKAALYIVSQFAQYGYKASLQGFTITKGDTSFSSQNVIVDSSPSLKKTLIVGAHFDSVDDGSGSMGAIDNASSIAVMLEVARLAKLQSGQSFNIRFIAFGAEENGLHGSRHYVEQLLQSEQATHVVGMINLDTIAGGDISYVHSAHSTPYKCSKTLGQQYSKQTYMRDALLMASQAQLKDNAYQIHKGYPNNPKGEAGGWSDHKVFACAGIAIAFIESTNYHLNGKQGNDGYSQTINDAFWDCFDKTKLSACDRQKERKWGEIWHTKYDDIDTLQQIFPERVNTMMAQHVLVLSHFLSEAEHYLAQVTKTE
ncbi:M20/M25/M40 family metallo-hydrolase [Thalassotalea sp. Y01]|uniref:M28 family metallopeptidase n=1 Tax=Thalassotalea sp. Y01 TaxID=2729613 RepID=UPI00145EF4BB|nr:M20/M25/M40 family metallo-hydrolase [Thalassotalea sp. Y01]NMP16703.1 M20/M25/M40 family metallo-hydrolase [Thalassotalea sp. Y01]